MRFSAEVQPHTFAANVATLQPSTGAQHLFAFDDATNAACGRGGAFRPFDASAFRPHGDAADAFLYGLEGSNLNDLSERFRGSERAQRADAEFQAYVDRLLAEKPSQWPQYAFWMLILTMFTVGIFGVCACLAG